MIIARLILIIVISYLLGSIPIGRIVSHFYTKKDLLNYGSGKTGATNVLRTAGRKAAMIVVVGDVCKGVLAVVFAFLIFGNDLLVIGNFGLGTLIAQVAAALAAVTGHIWSIFMKFKGGRGVATFFGGMVALCPPAALLGSEVLFVSAGLSNYASFGSIAGVVAAYVVLVPLTIIYKFPIEYLVYALIGGLIIIYMHRDNIGRLIAGKERKLGEKAKKVSPTV
jgi:acyl phosphate:glycerol-3-phosphate acyltransferase